MTAQASKEIGSTGPNRQFVIYDLLVFTLGFAICLTVARWWGMKAVIASLVLGMLASFTPFTSIGLKRFGATSAIGDLMARFISAFQVAFAMTIIALIIIIVLVLFVMGRQLTIEWIYWGISKLNLYSHAIGLAFPRLGSSFVKLNRILTHAIFGRT